VASDRASEDPDDRPDGRPAGVEAFAGGILVACTILGALAIAAHPGPNPVDHLGFAWIARSIHSPTLSRVTDLGSAAVLAAGSILAALVCVRRDRWRAVACVAGPFLCAVSVEYLFKPLVGRHFEGVLTYPSGSTADIAAVATAWTLAVPARWRPLFVGVGVIVAGAMIVAVIGLRWHYPSDALAGAVLGVGAVLLVDGLLHLGPAARFALGGRSRPIHADRM
jgi:membrane-associated phospholipid phosphatase